MPLAKPQLYQLRSRAHHLKPIVKIGERGITENVLAELDQALTHHELLKVSIAALERSTVAEIATALCQASQAELVQIIGKTAILYRPTEKA